jgi:Uma2 family endonuclease
MASSLKMRLDYGDYCAIPPDGNRYELIEGELHVTPAPSPRHQEVVGSLFVALHDHFSPPAKVYVSPIDVILSPYEVFQPDIVVVDNPVQISDRGIEGAPPLIVEVLSPTTGAYDRTTKSHRYAALGVAHYWIVDPATRMIECYRLEAGAYRLVASAREEQALTHPDFPDLRLALSILWA